MFYILDGQTVKLAPNVQTWARWFETADRVVRKHDSL
jgi:hypothetical protein